jgi:glucosamine 6-phosphate synthetase-like amidotransferase/phosphosugar isomerase protein
VQILEMEVASIMKGAYDHFMQKEIHEQPESLAQTLMGRIKVKARRSFRSDSGSVSDSDCSDSGMSSNSDSPNNMLGCKVCLQRLVFTLP